MREEKLGFGVIFRMIFSLLPLLFGMPIVAVLLCAYNIAMSFIVFGPVNGTVSSLSAVCISMFFCGTYGETEKLTGLFLGIEAVACAVACFYSVLKRKNFYSGVFCVAGAYLVPYFIQIHSTAQKAGLSVAQFFSKDIAEIFSEESQLLLAESPQLIDAASLKQLETFLIAVTRALVPSVLVLCSLLIGYIVMWCVCAQLRKTNNPIEHSFGKIKVPVSMVVLLIVSIVLMFFKINKSISAIALNICVVLTTICFVAGISFVDFYMRRTGKRMLPRIIIQVLLISLGSSFLINSPFFNVFTIYVLLAVVDSFADFRKVRKSAMKGADVYETKK